jgi:hypothetical protein
MGHCGGFGYTLWATAADLVMRYGLLRRMRPYRKNLSALWGISAGFGYALWAIAQDLGIRYGP